MTLPLFSFSLLCSLMSVFVHKSFAFNQNPFLLRSYRFLLFRLFCWCYLWFSNDLFFVTRWLKFEQIKEFIKQNVKSRVSLHWRSSIGKKQPCFYFYTSGASNLTSYLLFVHFPRYLLFFCHLEIHFNLSDVKQLILVQLERYAKQKLKRSWKKKPG